MRYSRKKSLRKKLLLIIVCCIAFLVFRCGQDRYPSDYRQPCYVFLIGDADYADGYMCGQGGNYYYYVYEKGIYKFTCGSSPELIVSIPQKARRVKLACTDRMLYYSIQLINQEDNSSEKYMLYSYNLTENRDIEMGIEMDRYSCVLIGAHGQDVFWEGTENEIPVLYCLHDTEYEMVDISNGIEELSYRDYILRKDEDGWVTNIRCTTDGWQNSISELYVDGSYFSLDTAKDYTGESDDLHRTVQGDVGATWYHLMEEEKGLVYALYQCGWGREAAHINPTYREERDAIYLFDVENKSIECFYRPDEEDEEIVDFSIENEYMYLLRNDGLYKCNLQGGEQQYILDENVDRHVFVDLDGMLFWFEENYVEELEELAAVIRADTGEIVYRK